MSVLHTRNWVALSNPLPDLDSFWHMALTLMVEAVSISALSVNFYQTTWYNIPEDSHL